VALVTRHMPAAAAAAAVVVGTSAHEGCSAHGWMLVHSMRWPRGGCCSMERWRRWRRASDVQVAAILSGRACHGKLFNCFTKPSVCLSRYSTAITELQRAKFNCCGLGAFEPAAPHGSYSHRAVSWHDQEGTAMPRLPTMSSLGNNSAHLTLFHNRATLNSVTVMAIPPSLESPL